MILAARVAPSYRGVFYGTENLSKMGMSGVLNLKAGPSIPPQADLGRFISRDPIGFAGGLNLFNGASTNPVTFVDPGGLQPSGKVLLYCPHGTGNINVDDLETSVRLHGLDFEITNKHPGFLGYKNGTQAIEVTFRQGIRMNGPEMLIGESKRGRVLLFPDSVKKFLDNRRKDGSCPSPMTDAAALANIMTYNIKHEVLVHHTGNFIERDGRRFNVIEDYYERDGYLEGNNSRDILFNIPDYVSPDHPFRQSWYK